MGLRSGVTGVAVDTLVSQSAWNLDKLDGTGPSQITLDITKAQIFGFDFQWLGTGRVRYGFYFAGAPVYCHQLTNENSLSSVYMSNPNLPVRYEILNLGGQTTGTLETICSTVISEGGFDPNGIIYGIDMGVGNSVSIGSGVYRPVIAIRLQSGSLASSVSVQSLALITQGGGTAYGRFTLLFNPTIASGSLSWSQQPNSSVEFATGSTTLVIGSEGTKLYSDYFAGAVHVAGADLKTSYTLGAKIDGTPDILVLAAEAINLTNPVSATINVREIR